jgi:hypothetical protein
MLGAGCPSLLRYPPTLTSPTKVTGSPSLSARSAATVLCEKAMQLTHSVSLRTDTRSFATTNTEPFFAVRGVPKIRPASERTVCKYALTARG